MYTPPVTPWELEMPEVSDLTAREELPKVEPMTGERVEPMTGVKS